MRLIDEIIGEVDDAFVCRGRIPRALAVEGAASPLLGLELGAQAAAVLGALDRSPSGDGAPSIGYLVSVRDARFESASLPAESALTVRVRSLGGVSPLANYRIEVSDSSGDYLSATIGTWIVS